MRPHDVTGDNSLPNNLILTINDVKELSIYYPLVPYLTNLTY